MVLRKQQPQAPAQKLATAREQVQSDPWDEQAWQVVSQELQRQQPDPAALAEQRVLFEELLTQFPTAALHWKRYAELSLAANTAEIKRIFGRCLLSCHYLELWQVYLAYIKKTNQGRGDQGMIEVRNAYEYTIARMGFDIQAGPLWQEYINFLSGPRPGTPAYRTLWATGAPGQEDNNRLMTIRRAFHRALQVPMAALDQLWHSYEQFEAAGANKQLIRRLLEEHRPRYLAAKEAFRERKRLLAAVNLTLLAFPPGRAGFVQQQQAEAWQAYLAWERSNPQRLEQEAYAARVQLAYDQALMVLLHYPEVWAELANFHMHGGGLGTAAALQALTRGRQTLPSCLMLHFLAADIEEQQGNIAPAKQVYVDLVGNPGVNADAEDAEPKVQLPKELASLAWVQYMSFTRRTTNIKAARQVFLDSRKWKDHGWQVYAAAALMEWRSDPSNDKVPKKVFELGAKRFLGNPDFVLAYVDFQCSLGDIVNARALFERALTVTQGPDVAKLWDRYLLLEYENGTAAAVTELSKRRSAALSEEQNQQPQPLAADLRLQLLKYSTLGLHPCTADQHQHFRRLTGKLPKLPSPAAAAAAAVPVGLGAGQNGAALPIAMQAAHAGLPHASPAQEHWSPAAQPRSPGAVQPLTRPQLHPGRVGGQPPPAAPPRPGAPLTQLPYELGQFINALPLARTLEGPHPAVDMVMDALMQADLSPEGLMAAEEQLFGSWDMQAHLQPPPPPMHAGSMGASQQGGAGRFGQAPQQPGPPHKRHFENMTAAAGGLGDDGHLSTASMGPHSDDIFRKRQFKRARGGADG